MPTRLVEPEAPLLDHLKVVPEKHGTVSGALVT